MRLIVILLFVFSLLQNNVSLEEKLLRILNPAFLTRRQPLLLRRNKRQQRSEEDCQFSVTAGVVDPCSLIINPGGLSLNPWQLGIGATSNWIGGPRKDASGSQEGGYAFVRTADKMGSLENATSWMVTPPREATGADGQCLTFKYQISGISAKEIAVGIFSFKGPVKTDDIIAPPTISPSSDERLNVSSPNEKPPAAKQLNSLPDDFGDLIGDHRSDHQHNEEDPLKTGILFSNADPQSPVLTSSTEREGASGLKYTVSKLWVRRDSTNGEWKTASISFNSAKIHSIGFKASADTRYRSYRGHIAVDNIEFIKGPCDSDCQFNNDFCSWTNAGRSEDDFDWSLGRSTKKRGTGPSRDHESTFIPGLETGGFAFIDSGFPRRPFDKARIFSREIVAGDAPLCLKLWVHMYGVGIGTLSVLKRVADSEPVKIWTKEGSDLLDRWYLSQLTLTARKGTLFRIIIEGEVGSSGKGDIAIDTVTLKEGACPGLPSGSGVGLSIADCSFFINSCEWTLYQPSTLTTSFTPMLIQSAGSAYTPEGHTPGFFEGKDYYMKFDLGNYKHRVRDSAFMVSPPIKNNGQGICLSFWVYMFTNVPTEMTVGALSVIISTSEKNTTVWRLENKQHSGWIYSQVFTKETNPIQIYFKGTKGTKKAGMIGVDDITVFGSDCSILPSEADVSEMDCSFDSDECSWKIESTKAVKQTVDPNESWRYANDKFLIHVVTDHTYKIDKAGFMFIEAFNADISSVMVSPLVDTGQNVTCFSFYFASFFADNTAQLMISLRSDKGEAVTQFRVTQANLPPRPVGNVEVEWTYAQLPVAPGSFNILIEGKVRTGGWAIDDVKLTPGRCSTRPTAASVLPPNGFPALDETLAGPTSEVGTSGGNVSSLPSGVTSQTSGFNDTISTAELDSSSGAGVDANASSANSSVVTDEIKANETISEELDSSNKTSSVNGTEEAGTTEGEGSPVSADKPAEGKDGETAKDTAVESDGEKGGSGDGADESGKAPVTEEPAGGEGSDSAR